MCQIIHYFEKGKICQRCRQDTHFSSLLQVRMKKSVYLEELLPDGKLQCDIYVIVNKWTCKTISDVTEKSDTEVQNKVEAIVSLITL